MSRSKPIGVFDSGIGGLTVLSDLIEMFPHEDFIYVADTFNVPYGTKPNEEIEKLVLNVGNYLLNQDVKAIVIACNTATANSSLLRKSTNIPIIGVIEPTAKAAINATSNNKVAILATNATINSESYQELMEDAVSCFPVKCSDFVPAIEGGLMDTEYSYNLVAKTLASIKDEEVDTVILGCTHFGLFSREILNVFPTATLVGCGKPTAKYLYDLLFDLNLLNDQSCFGKVILNTSGVANEVEAKIKWFDKPYIGINEIKL